MVYEIDSSEVSVVLQGPVEKGITHNAIKKIRKVLPQSEIILSTWENSNVSDIAVDSLILNKDPGGFPDKNVKTFTNNTLRQLTSTIVGIRKAKRKYILKMRSDIYLENDNFLKYFQKFPKRDERFKFFSHRIIICSFFSKKYLSYKNLICPVPYHMSDWLAFGLNEDIKKLYDIELPVEPDNSWYFADIKTSTEKVNLLGCSHRFAPEQYIFVNSFSKCFDLNFSDYMDYNKINISLSERLFANNFIILDPWQLKLTSGKEKTGNDKYRLWTKCQLFVPHNLWVGLYRNYIFQCDYIKYCDKDYNIALYDSIKEFSLRVWYKWIRR